jgi:hypothetical protein
LRDERRAAASQLDRRGVGARRRSVQSLCAHGHDTGIAESLQGNDIGLHAARTAMSPGDRHRPFILLRERCEEIAALPLGAVQRSRAFSSSLAWRSAVRVSGTSLSASSNPKSWIMPL